MPENLSQLQERFPINKNAAPNVFALKTPKNFTHTKEGTMLPQTYVDIWNLKDWYAKDFLRALEERMYTKLGLTFEDWY